MLMFIVLATMSFVAPVFAQQIGPIPPSDPAPRCQMCQQNCNLQSDICQSPCNNANKNCELGCGSNQGCLFNCAIAFNNCVSQCIVQRNKCWQGCPCRGVNP